MAQVQGTVFRIYDKQFSGRMTHTVKLDGDPLYYRMNNNRYAGIVEPGNLISFEATPNPDGTSAKMTSVPVIVKPSSPAAATPAAGGYADNKGGLQQRYQGALERAISMVKLLADTGSLKLPTAINARAGIVEAAVDRYTAQFFEDTNTLGAVTREAEGETGQAETDASEEDADA